MSDNNQEKEIIKLNRTDSKKLAWVQRAKSTDEGRLSLMGTFFDKGNIVCVDGYRLHITENSSPELYHLKGLKDMGKVRAGENILEVGPHIVQKFAEYEKVIPTTDPKFRIGINPKHLLDICKGLDKGSMLVIDFHDPSTPIELHGKIEDQDVYAIIMPMNLGDEYNRPTYAAATSQEEKTLDNNIE